MSFFKAFRILGLFLVISGVLLSTIQGNPEQAKVKKSDAPTTGPKPARVVSKDDVTTKTPALKGDLPKLSPPSVIVSAIMYSKNPKNRMIIIGEEVLKIMDKSSKYPDMVIIDIKPDSVVIKQKGKQEELFLEK